MKKQWLCLLIVAVCLFAGCASLSAEKPVIDVPAYDWGVKLTAKDVTEKGLTIVCTQSGGEAKGELQTGSWYEVQQKKGGTWKAVEYTEIEKEYVGWTSEAWCIPKGETVEWPVDWSWLYDTLPAGEYRIGKEIVDFQETGVYEETVIYAEFTIE